MIAKSDFVILLVSLSALGGGLYRWQDNKDTVPAVTVPASLQSSVRNPPTDSSSNTSSGAAATVSAEPQTAKPTSPRIVTETAAPTTIVVNTEGNDAATPGTTASPTTTANSLSNDSTSKEPLFGQHQVVYGDYLGKIANRYGTSISELRRINNLSGSSIFAGQILRYPLPAN